MGHCTIGGVFKFFNVKVTVYVTASKQSKYGFHLSVTF